MNELAIQRNFFVHEKPKRARLTTSEVVLPAEDNTPEGLRLLLKANRQYREQPWPEPFNRTIHRLRVGDARDLSSVPSNSVHLVVTSPPYWTLKEYAAGNDRQWATSRITSTS